jgi:hypothetical protein
VILSFMLGSMALQRIQAKRGGLPPRNSIFSGTGEVVGFRIK